MKRDMKKRYMKPSMDVIRLQQTQVILAGSGYNDEINAPGFDWIEKGYQFGGWDLEEG
jgi:hypothetical protein